MEYDLTLSVVIITMNRKILLSEAIESCLKADIPQKNEIIIIDNGSTDGSEEWIQSKFPTANIVYKYQEENRGIGGGRNIGIGLAKGKYVYILDDDAVINPKCSDFFFTSSIAMFEASPDTGGITTRVYDETLKRYRESRRAKTYTNNNPQVLMLHGNTHFIRNGITGVEYCPTIRYGFEDLYASIRIDDADYKVVLNEDTETIHKPLTDKWSKHSPYRRDTVIKEISGKLTVKALMFPGILLPLLLITAALRVQKSLGMDFGAFKEVLSLYNVQTRNVRVDKVKAKTIRFLLKEYGISAIL